MAIAVCKECGVFFVWKAGKGAKLSYLKCTQCDGELRSMKRKDGELRSMKRREGGDIRNRDMIDLRHNN